jgi:dienelactone hydrolase
MSGSFVSKPFCINCISGSIIPGEPKGCEVLIGKFNTYVAQPSSGVTDESKIVISFTDVFGLAVNNKLVADMVADQSGYTVYVPDLFNGKPMDVNYIKMPTTTKEAESQSYFTKISTGLKLVGVVPWMYRNWPSSKFKDVEAYIATLKKEKSAQKIGAIG